MKRTSSECHLKRASGGPPEVRTTRKVNVLMHVSPRDLYFHVACDNDHKGIGLKVSLFQLHGK